MRLMEGIALKAAIVFDKVRADTSGIYFERALKALGIEAEHFWMRDAGKIEPKYDFYLRIDHGEYSQTWPSHLHPSAFWVSDTHLEKPFKKILAQAGDYDFIFCGMKEGTLKLKREGFNVIWSPAACDPEIHRRLNLPRSNDIAFVGTDGGIPRKFYLQELRERYPNSLIGPADYREMSRIYSSAKIGFSYSIRNETLTFRSFEIMSCGAMLIVNPVYDSTIEDLGFKDRRDLVIYHSPKELFDLLDYYLKNQAEREAIAENGHRLAVSRHTYEHRVREILEVAKKGTGYFFATESAKI